MLIIPAIDIINGNVVRLHKGKKESCTIYGHHPDDFALKFKDAGAQLIHVVDLDAAFGQGSNIRAIKKIAKIGIPFEVGGGVRTLDRAQEFLDLGAQRVILGTKAQDEEFVAKIVAKFPGKIGAGVDFLNGVFMKSGWQEETGISFVDFTAFLATQGIRWIEYTDISRDGTLEGINIDDSLKLASFENMDFILSGGVASFDDLALAASSLPFLKGVIVGKAYYEGKIDITRAIASFQTP